MALNLNGGCGGTEFSPLDSNNGLLDEADRLPSPSCNADTADNILVNACAAGISTTLADNGGPTRTHALMAGSAAHRPRCGRARPTISAAVAFARAPRATSAPTNTSRLRRRAVAAPRSLRPMTSCQSPRPVRR